MQGFSVYLNIESLEVDRKNRQARIKAVSDEGYTSLHCRFIGAGFDAVFQSDQGLGLPVGKGHELKVTVEPMPIP